MPVGVCRGRHRRRAHHPARRRPRPLPAGSRTAAPGPLRLGYAGRLAAERGVVLLADAVLRLAADGPPFVLHVAGTGPAQDNLRAALRAVDVVWHGFLPHDELARMLARLDVYVAPCPVESFGLATLEALACGVPVAGFAAGATPEVVGRAAVLSERRSAVGLAAAIREAAALPPHARATARRRATQFSWAATALRLDALLRQVAGADPVRELAC